MVNPDTLKDVINSRVPKNVTDILQTVAVKPFHTITVLLQVGYEPLPPIYNKRGFFKWSKGYYYPSIWEYINFLVKKEGSYLVLYRGLTPRVCSVLVSNTVRTEVLCSLPKSTSKCPPEAVAVEVGRQCLATIAAVLASHPFLVITNRMIVSLIGGEDKYSSFTDAILTIYREDGLAGYYAGVVPHLLGEVSGKAIETLVGDLTDRYELYKRLGFSERPGSVLPASMIHAYFSYPLQLTTTIMSCNRCGLEVSNLPSIQGSQTGWVDCLKSLYRSGNLKRGNNLLFARKAASESWHTPALKEEGETCKDGSCEVKKQE